MLVCNYFDPIDYIIRTLKFIEAINGTKVIAVTVFPMDYDMNWSVLGNRTKVVEAEKILAKKNGIHKASGKKVYTLGNKEEMRELFQDILSYFEGDS